MNRGQNKIGRRLGVNNLRKLPMEVERAATETKGSMGRINSTKVDTYVDFDELGGRGKARRDAKTKKKIAKKGAPSRKERKGVKTKAKAKAKVIRAEKSTGEPKGMKVLDTINKTVNAAASVMTGQKIGSEEQGEPTTAGNESADAQKAAFSFTAWYMILAYVVIVALILYFVFKKK